MVYGCNLLKDTCLMKIILYRYFKIPCDLRCCRFFGCDKVEDEIHIIKDYVNFHSLRTGHLLGCGTDLEEGFKDNTVVKDLAKLSSSGSAQSKKRIQNQCVLNAILSITLHVVHIVFLYVCGVYISRNIVGARNKSLAWVD
mmetsp:Transcript_17454/g.22991  ORF Transcript_17454/g.22991 Transcript_17454/m.22991 type:complete len:141 (-) Transcript_17454:2831-3253(-)